MTVIDIVRPYALQKLRPAIIAAHTGLPGPAVRNALHKLREQGLDVPRHMTGNVPRTLGRRAVSIESAAYLSMQARRRGVSTNTLILRLLDAIATDDMVDAILDDGGAA